MEKKLRWYWKSINQGGWRTINSFGPDSNTVSYLDKSVSPSTEYAYLLIAIDSSGNESTLSRIASITSKATSSVSPISNVEVDKDYENDNINECIFDDIANYVC